MRLFKNPEFNLLKEINITIYSEGDENETSAKYLKTEKENEKPKNEPETDLLLFFLNFNLEYFLKKLFFVCGTRFKSSQVKERQPNESYILKIFSSISIRKLIYFLCEIKSLFNQIKYDKNAAMKRCNFAKVSGKEYCSEFLILFMLYFFRPFFPG